MGGNPDALRRLGARALVLFAVLTVVKLAMLAGMGKHLHQTHWRVGDRAIAWYDHANFHLFTGLIVGSLVLLGRRAQQIPRWDLRGLNAGLGISGLLFVFFQFQQMNQNYVVPVIDGVLPVSGVASYLWLNLFFAMPYLGAYAGIYLLSYWVLARSGREHWTVYLLALLAGTYLEVNLHSALAHSGDALLLINCVGVGGLASCLGSGRPPRNSWLAMPAVLVVPVWWLLARYEPDLADPSIHLLLLLAIAGGLYLAAVVLWRRSHAAGVLNHFLMFYLVAFVLCSVRNFPLADNYNNFLAVSLGLPRYFIADAVLVLAVFAGTVWLHRWSARMAVIVFDAAALLLSLVAIVDWKLTQTMGVRLDWQALVMTNNATMLWRTIEPFAVPALLGLAVLVTVYLGLSWAVHRRVSSNRTDGTGQGLPTGQFAVLTLALLAIGGMLTAKSDKAQGNGLVGVVASSPVFRSVATERMSAEKFAAISRELALPEPTPAAVAAASQPAKLNVLLIIMESSYNRYLSLFGAPDETQPRLKKYRDRMELFPNFFSTYPNSFHARFTVLNGLYAPKEYVTHIAPRIECPNIFEVLNAYGYENSAFDSCSRDYVRWVDYLGHRKLAKFHDCDSMPGREKFPKVSWGVSESATLAAIQQEIADVAGRGQRFCLTYLPVAPHMPFDSPAREFEKFPNGIGTLDGNFAGRYKNQLLYMDWIITSMIDSLAEHGLLDKTLVVITNDHGEMVGEDDGRLGHGWMLEPRLCNTPLIIMDPRQPGYRVNYTIGSQVDVLPTMLDLLNVPLPPGELYEGLPLHSEAAKADRPIYFNSANHRALLTGRQFIWEENFNARAPGKGRTRVFDLANDGVRTLFTETATATNVTERLNTYERYQRALITDYSYYRQLASRLATREQFVQVPR